MPQLFLINLAINTFTTLWFSIDTDIKTFSDVMLTMACCVIPIIPIGYAYRLCNKFVRGEI